MSQIREIKQRIESVKKTKKITQAMKMVAAAKFKKASDRITVTQGYLGTLNDTKKEILERLEPDFEPTLMTQNDGSKDALIVIAGNRGLCGAFNTNVIKTADTFLKNAERDTDLFIFGHKAYVHFKKTQFDIKQTTELNLDDLSFDNAANSLKDVIAAYTNGEYKNVWVIYNHFISALNAPIQTERLLPISQPSESTNKADTNEQVKSDFYYESGRESVLNDLLDHYIGVYFFNCLLESMTSQEALRMTAMDSATSNASDMIKDLTLLFNRKRQAAITTELTEIVAGAETLVQ